MPKKVLVTGGAGFIGSHMVDKLIENGHEVRIFDNLDKQVHKSGKKPPYLNDNAELVKGDVRNKKQLKKALEDIEGIFHFAAAVGVGQSMYELNYYIETNVVGTSNLLELLVNSDHDVKKIIIAASMSSYGEGSYRCENCGIVEPPLRVEGQLNEKKWEVFCPSCKKMLAPLPTPETKIQSPNSIYALTKKNQEEMALMIGKTYGISVVSMRFFNVFGTRQSLSNPYTGVGAIFLSRIKNKKPPFVYEDGLQTRDFISVNDLVEANYMAFNSTNSDFETFNVGSGKPVSIKKVAQTISEKLGSNIEPKITGEFRKGDVRHCFADISKITSKIGWKPKTSFESGIKELVDWSKNQNAVDKFDHALSELKARNLT